MLGQGDSTEQRLKEFFCPLANRAWQIGATQFGCLLFVATGKSRAVPPVTHDISTKPHVSCKYKPPHTASICPFCGSRRLNSLRKFSFLRSLNCLYFRSKYSLVFGREFENCGGTGNVAG